MKTKRQKSKKYLYNVVTGQKTLITKKKMEDKKNYVVVFSRTYEVFAEDAKNPEKAVEMARIEFETDMAVGVITTEADCFSAKVHLETANR